MKTRTVTTLIVGSGAAALKAAVTLHALGHRDILIVTERWGGGTSANAGSDKQTYYKLSLAGEIPDSGAALAETLFAGGCVHGDIALAEAQHSAQAFYHLVAIGVPFPHDTYGAFPGYRTDHDPRGRGTSAGPSTSRQMVEALSREVRERGIEVLDPYQVISLLAEGRGADRSICGAIALDLEATREAAEIDDAVVLCNATNVVFATGGPGAMYADSVYPEDQVGSIGMAMAIGAVAQNLTESQFGLASIGFRWNVSGSYQQVVPRYVSTDRDGHDAREFLNEAFGDAGTLGSAIFRKGYQWPFDPRKVSSHGSSLIDLLVYRERTIRGRRVFLDFTRDFRGSGSVGPFSFEALDGEAREYLGKSDALGPSPIARLERLNPPAIALYREHGIDIAREPLEIAVCAQHNNGGLTGNHWWESNVRGLFPVGEVNGSHGVYRPGGSALNAGQVGALRAAMYIAKRRSSAPMSEGEFRERCREQIEEVLDFARRSLAAGRSVSDSPGSRRGVRRTIQQRMSDSAAHIRRADSVEPARAEAWKLYESVRECLPARTAQDLPDLFRDRDMALAHALYLESLAEYLARGGQSRGSYLVLDPDGDQPCDPLGPGARFRLETRESFVSTHVLEIAREEDGRVRKDWVPVRPIPRSNTWYESVWSAFRSDEVVR